MCIRDSFSAVALFPLINGIGAHIDMVIACQSQVYAKFVKQIAPSAVLRCFATVTEEPLVMFTNHPVSCRIIFYNIANPFLSSSQTFVIFHAFIIEHYKESITPVKPVADTLFSFVAVAGIEIGLFEIFVGVLDIAA